MRSIAIINQKGGVGKTTTVIHLADGLARAGRRVLVVDLDPQAHASLHLGMQPGTDEPSIYDVLIHGAPIAEVCRTVNEHFSLLPASIDLVGFDLEVRERGQRELLLAGALDAYREAFDFCLIDCAPSLGLLTINALATVTEVMIPLQPHFLALQGLGRLLETVTLVREALNPRVRVSGIILCIYEKGTRLAQEVLADVTGFIAGAQPADAWYGARVFETKIRRNIKLAECPSFGQTVFDYAPGSNGAEDYLALAREILGESPPEEQAEPPTQAVSKPVSEVVPLSNPPPQVGRPVSVPVGTTGDPAPPTQAEDVELT